MYTDQDPVTSALLTDSRKTQVGRPLESEVRPQVRPQPESPPQNRGIDGFEVGFWYGLAIASIGLIAGFGLACLLMARS